MNGYNFTERVRRVLMRAREEATALHHEYVGTEHILLGLVEGGGVAAAALEHLGANTGDIRQKVLLTVKPGPADSTTSASGASGGILGAIADTMGLRHRMDMPYTSRAKKVLELAMSEARDLNHSYVGTEHLLIGLLREERGIAAQVLASMGLTTTAVRDEVVRILGVEAPKPSEHPQRRPRDDQPEKEAAITLIIEHTDGRIEAKKFRHTGDAVHFLNGLEY